MRLLATTLLYWSSYAMACEVKFDASIGTFENYSSLFMYIKSEVLPVSIATDTEYVGLVYRHRNGLHSVLARGCPGADQFSFKYKRNTNLVSVWHTHGAPGYLREAFSPEDAILVQILEVPLYLISPSGNVRVLGLASAARSPQRLTEPGSMITALGYSGNSLTVATNR